VASDHHLVGFSLHGVPCDKDSRKCLHAFSCFNLLCIDSASNLQQLPYVNCLIESTLQLRYIDFSKLIFFAKRIVVLSCNYNH
jgi:hypothetical protein